MAVAVFVMMIFLLSPFFLKITSTNKGGVRKNTDLRKMLSAR